MARNDDGAPDQGSRSGGGITFGGGARSTARGASSPPEAMTTLRRRWTTGIAVVTTVDADGGRHGITVSSLMFVSNDPPVMAVGLTSGGDFQRHLAVGTAVGMNILETRHEFPAERFAGRAPVPDGRFTGIAYGIVNGAPVLDGALAWGVGGVRSLEPVGDHLLALIDITAVGLGEDTDDPLLSYEGRYRRLEAG